MSKLPARRFILTGLLGGALLAAGCFEEKDSITVYADGSGKIHLHKKLNKDSTASVTTVTDREKKQAAFDDTLYKDLGLWQGIAAWTACEAALDGDCLVTGATGYFADIRKLQRREGAESQSFRWARNDDGGFTLTWRSENPDEKEPFTGPAPSAEDQKMATQMTQMMKGLRVEREMILPGPANEWIGCNTHQGRSASLVYTDNDAFRLDALQHDLENKIANGDLTKDQAREAYKQESQRLGPKVISVTCGPGDVADEFEQFQQDFAQARETYAKADTAGKIQAARAKQP